MTKRKKIGIEAKTTSKDLRIEAREKWKKLGKHNRIFAYIVCNECRREYKIRVNTKEEKEAYHNMKETWLCLVCRSRKGRKNVQT